MTGRKKNTDNCKASQASMTNLQKRRRLEKSRRDERVRMLKKYPLCVSVNFLKFAEQKQWNDKTTDAAALIMHRYFVGEYYHKLHDGWLPIPHQTFRAMFGEKYVPLKKKLIADGFLEFDDEAGCKIGEYCYRFRPCRELRETKISGSYRLQSDELQILYLNYKKRFQLSPKKRKTSADKMIKIAFAKDGAALTPSDRKWIKENWIRSYYSLVQNGHLTETEFATIETLARNTFELKIDLSDAEITEIAKKQFAKPTRKGKPRKHDFPAFLQIFRGGLENTRLPSVKVKTSGRFFTPFTNLFRSLWDHVVHEERPLVSIDISSSHPHCLLAFIKDIAENFFGTEGTFEERLSACRFSRQILIVPNLVYHLRRSLFFYQDNRSYKYLGPNFRKPENIRKKTHRMFEKFSRHLFEKAKWFGAGAYFSSNLQAYLTYSPDSVNLSPHYDPSCISTKLPSNFPSIPFTFLSLSSLISRYKTVVLEPELLFIHDVERELRACNFYSGLCDPTVAEQSVSSPPTPTTKPLFTPEFRDLFFPNREEIAEFERILKSDIYTLLMEAAGIKGKNRDFFKREFFHFLYKPPFKKYEKKAVERHAPTNDPPPLEPVRKAFGTLLPSILFFLDLCKCPPGTIKRGRGRDGEKRYHRFISQAMQAVESQIMLECCENLLKKNPGMFLTSVHDCIKCHPEDAEQVQEELKATLAKYSINQEPEIKFHGKSAGSKPTDPLPVPSTFLDHEEEEQCHAL